MKIQFINKEIKFNEWTVGRWAIPIESIWEKEIYGSFNIVCFPIQKYNYKRKFTTKRKCLVCGREFIINSSNQIMCGFCFNISTCFICKKVFITQNKIENNEKEFCSRDCSRKYAASTMTKWHEKNPEQRSKNLTLSHKNGSGKKFCIECNEETSHLIGIGCVSCHNKTENKRLSSKINMIKTRKQEIFKKQFNQTFCKKCNKITPHKFFTCLICKPEANKFVIKQIIENNPNCIIHPNEINMIYSEIKHQYVCFTCFKENIKNNNIIFIDFIKIIKKIYKNAYIQNTFRNNDSIDWKGARSLFEKDLADQNITYFVYIKFYINKIDNIKPLVAGISASTLVNMYGSDVSFSTEQSDGPARLFLYENNLKWNKESILIIPTQSREESLNIEYNIAKTYELFQS